MEETVMIGMSGGVDSAVAALLLKESGYEVVGLFMHNWEEEEGGACTSAEDWKDAMSVASRLGIRIYSVNFAREYMERVFSYFLDEYAAGRTPNPDVLCNREIKFDAFSRYAAELGGKYVATGHYCGITHTAGEGHETRLLRAADSAKDQTYFLNQVRTEQLENVMFPLARMTKPEVRALAERYGLDAVAKKKDSTGICFIGERKFKRFLMEYLPARPGDIVDTSGNVVGRHDGLMYYTLGQRRGLGIGGMKDHDSARWFVVEKDLKNNRLVVSCGEDDVLYTRALTAVSLNFIGAPPPAEFDCTAKTRYRQPDTPCHVSISDGVAHVLFDLPRRAVTPGQYVVFYEGERCLGGGVISVAHR